MKTARCIWRRQHRETTLFEFLIGGLFLAAKATEKTAENIDKDATPDDGSWNNSAGYRMQQEIKARKAEADAAWRDGWRKRGWDI